MATVDRGMTSETSLGERLRASRPLTILFFITVTGASYAAHLSSRPITSALVYVIGVMVIGASCGRRAGLMAAVAASCIYCLLIKNPAFEFKNISLDYYVPLIAFNITALLSGTLAGRLKDRAESAENARSQLDLLLEFSSRLQKAVRIEDVADTLRATVSKEVIRERILPFLNESPSSKSLPSLRKVVDLAGEAAFLPHVNDRQFDARDIDLPAFVDLLRMAIERCDLLDRQAEGQAIKRSEDLKTTILSSISHDLRTPLASIAASATSLKRFGDSFSPEVRSEMLQTIEDQCTRLDRFTAKLLSFGRLQGGVVSRQLEPVDVVELLGNAVQSARLTGTYHAIRKEFPDAPTIVMANPAMLEQVFFNILENGIAYTPDGSEILINIELDADTARILIRDNGRGVSPENIDHIFEPFFRSEHPRSTNGQGLGLFIARGFVEAFGGKIAAKSPHESGRGLEISILLPLIQQEMEGSANGRANIDHR